MIEPAFCCEQFVGLVGSHRTDLAKAAILYCERKLYWRNQTRFIEHPSAWVLEVSQQVAGSHLRHVEVQTQRLETAHHRVTTTCEILGQQAGSISWNADEFELTLSADSTGRRTLFATTASAEWVAFANDLNALTLLLDLLGEKRTLNLAAWRKYLSLSFIPAPETPWDQTKTIEAGHTETWKKGRGFIEKRRHFSVCSADSYDDDEPITNELIDTMTRVSGDLKPPTTPWLLLSGGLDSALVAVALKQTHGAHCLTIDFEEESEANIAASIAKHLGLEHQRISVNGAAVNACIDELTVHLDWPVGDPVVGPFFLMAQVASRHTRSLWNGEGGDQLFAGWATKPMLSWARYASANDDPAPVYVQTFHKLADIEDEAFGPVLLDARNSIEPVADSVRSYLVAPESQRHSSFFQQLCEANLWLKGAGNILPRIDRMCRAAGVASVSPLVDERVVQLAFRVAPTQKQRGITEKWVMRNALRKYLPESILDLPKRGMKVPLKLWFTQALGERAHDVLLSKTFRQRGHFSPIFCDKLLQDDVRAPDLRRRRRDEWLWLILMSELWLQTHSYVERPLTTAR